MSGSSAFPTPVSIGTNPRDHEGSKVVTVPVSWASVKAQSGSLSQQINLLSQYQTGQFTSIQAVYIDNNTVPYEVTLVCQETTQRLRVPPFSAGVYPLYSGPAPIFTATLVAVADPFNGVLLTGCTTTFHFLNTHQQMWESRQPAYGQNFLTYSTAFNLAPATIQGQFLPPLGGKNHYVISAMMLNFTNDTASSVSTNIGVRLFEDVSGSGGRVLWHDVLSWPSGAIGILYRLYFQFPTPLLAQNSNNGLWIGAESIPVGNLLVTVTLLYGIVDIA